MNRTFKITILMVLLVTCSITVYAQSDNIPKTRTFSIQANPIIYLADLIYLGIDDDDPDGYMIFFDFEFQYAINDSLNLSINPQLLLYKHWYVKYSNGDAYDSKQTELIITPGLLFRPFKTRLKGMYVGLYVPIGWSNISQEGYSRTYYGFTDTKPGTDDNFTLLGVGVSIGYQWVFNKGFTISLGGGGRKIWPVAAKGNTGEYEKAESLFKLPFDLTMTFRLGYSF